MPPLDRFRHLDPSSPEFPDHLTSLFHEPGYRDYVASLEDDKSAWLVEYLNDVRLCAPLTGLPPKAE